MNKEHYDEIIAAVSKDPEKFDKWIQAEAEGRMLILPCKMGSIIYRVKLNTEACETCDHYDPGAYGDASVCHDPAKDDVILYPEYHDDEHICPKHFYCAVPISVRDSSGLLSITKRWNYNFFADEDSAKKRAEYLNKSVQPEV